MNINIQFSIIKLGRVDDIMRRVFNDNKLNNVFCLIIIIKCKTFKINMNTFLVLCKLLKIYAAYTYFLNTVLRVNMEFILVVNTSLINCNNI